MRSLILLVCFICFNFAISSQDLMKIDSAKHFDLSLDFETRTTALVTKRNLLQILING